MFEVSWTDPERETVGERKSRKQNQQRSACAPRNGPTEPSQGSTSGDSSSRPPVMNVFGPGWKEPTSRRGRGKQGNSSSSTLRIDGPKASRKGANYAASSDSSFQETPRTSTTTMRTPDTEFFSDSNHSEYDHCRLSSPSGVSDSGTNSTWSLQSDSISSSAKIVQHLSPTSFVTQSTEITVTSRESIKDSQQAANMVHISASGSVHMNDVAGRRPSQAAILDFLNDNEHDSEKETEEEIPMPAKEPGLQPRPSKTPLWQPISWEPPEAWECSGFKGKNEVPPTFKTRGLGLPFQPVRPRRGSGRGMMDERAPDE
ncbi:hypothetical protein N431DRAFT_421916 [Stipitochalara longipes BDJ]|nr:hypothetical protein N431DRAFT_421916 [Stipitochalara longipes BDJ]